MESKIDRLLLGFEDFKQELRTAKEERQELRAEQENTNASMANQAAELVEFKKKLDKQEKEMGELRSMVLGKEGVN